MVTVVSAVRDEKLRTLLQKFFVLLGQRYSKHTSRAYQYDILEFLSADATWESVNSSTKHQWRAYFAARAGAGLGSNARAMSAWRSFFKFCASCGESVSSGLLGMTSKSYKQRIFQIPDPESVKGAITPRGAKLAEGGQTGAKHSGKGAQPDWVRCRNRALVVLMYATGMRVGEALGLREWGFDSSVVRIKGKGDKYRDVPVLPIVHKTIKEYLKLCPLPRTHLFVGVRGGPLSYSAVRAVVRSMQLGIATHGLRRSAATHLLRNGVDIESVKVLLGHSNLSTTQRYIAADHKHLHDVYRSAHRSMRK